MAITALVCLAAGCSGNESAETGTTPASTIAGTETKATSPDEATQRCHTLRRMRDSGLISTDPHFAGNAEALRNMEEQMTSVSGTTARQTRDSFRAAAASQCDEFSAMLSAYDESN
ncbi:hypothetical protein H0264_33330 [Nocardia huaxiensis]|uniref:DUF732 domain-containing protein n=1 Tax=Nocardia huaxiensis TaxID=2755382 RepID=A0A7D6ZNY7_9NOCA|nr:hypothetical protein [Nocardia huaxiensis]QLY30025.1 hypothetical protein H0264_33330 [Nocardia huaxiensis]